MPAARAYQQRRQHGHDDGVLGVARQISADENGHRAGRNRHDGADGDVDSVRRDDQRHADGQQHDGRAVLQDVDQVAVQVPVLDLHAKEMRREKQVEQQEDRKGDKGPQDIAAAQGFSRISSQFPPAIVRMMLVSFMSSPFSSAIFTLSFRTAIRLLHRTTSSNSEEMKMTPIPCLLRFRISSMISSLAPTSMPRVGSSRIRTIGIRGKPSGEHHFLLVAAAELAGPVVRAGSHDCQ